MKDFLELLKEGTQKDYMYLAEPFKKWAKDNNSAINSNSIMKYVRSEGLGSLEASWLHKIFDIED